MSDEMAQSPDGIWCVVANIKREHPFGEGGKETKVGTRQFRGGAKVHIGGCYAGTCDSVICIGLHRKSGRYITCVVSVMLVENFRAKVAYHPEVIQRINQDQRCWFRSQQDAETWAAEFPNWQEIWKPNEQTEQSEE